MTHGSLFSGIGGFDLAAEWMGWENVFHCEWNEFGQKILKYYWPNAISYGDITKTDFTIWRGKIDILTGGFPCQPYSTAGKRLGKDDERHLWPEMLRAIQEIQPSWVVGENVLGLVNWNGGLVFDEVQSDLEAQGYEVQPYILPACAVNAPHRRDRIWFVAYRTNAWLESLQCAGQNRVHEFEAVANSESIENKRRGQGGLYPEFAGVNAERVTTNTENTGFQARINGQGKIELGRRDGTVWKGQWHGFPTQSPVCSRNDGVPYGLDGITFSKWRNESIKAYGNAIVPQVAYQIFKAIEAYSLTHNQNH